MSFVFKKTDTFKHRVDVVVPGDDPNKPHTGHFFATSRRYSKDKIRELTEPDTAPGDDEFIRHTLVKVEGFEVEGGTNDQEALREAIISDPSLSAAYLREYFKASTGAAEKNSARSSRR